MITCVPLLVHVLYTVHEEERELFVCDESGGKIEVRVGRAMTGSNAHAKGYLSRAHTRTKNPLSDIKRKTRQTATTPL